MLRVSMKGNDPIGLAGIWLDLLALSGLYIGAPLMSNKIPHCLLASVSVSYDIGFAVGFQTRLFS